MDRVLFTRREHGSLPVHVLGTRGRKTFQVQGQSFPSFRSMMLSLAGHDPKIGFRRYFRLAAYNERPPVVATLEEMLIQRGSFYVVRRDLGIDLSSRRDDVERLLRKGFGKWIARSGYDLEDVLQSVYLGIEIRNEGKGAWNPERSSFGHYVYLVCNSVLTNLHNKEQRRRQREQLGLCEQSNGERVWVDVASATTLGTIEPFDGDDNLEAVEDLHQWIESSPESYRKSAQVALEILPYVNQGMRRAEIATATGMGISAVGRALAYLRGAAREWARAGN